MFDLGWTELLVIGIVSLIVVGPKDLPLLFRNVGRFVGKARGMAREFTRAMNDAANESGVGEVSKTFKAATNPIGMAVDELKSTVTKVTRDINPVNFDPTSETGKLAAERAEESRKIREAAGQAHTQHDEREFEDAMNSAGDNDAKLKTTRPEIRE